MLASAGYYLGVSAGLAQLQLSRRSADPVEAIREQLRHREQRFLQLARYALGREGFYRRLFEIAGCSYADLEDGVQKHGLRATLGRLAAAGVYTTHDEFRGRTEIVRGGQHLPWSPANWSNPWGRGLSPQSTSGSTGQQFVTVLSNEFMLYGEGHETLQIRAMDMRRRSRVLAGPILPSAWTIRRQVTWHRLGVPVDCWFAVAARESPWIARAVTQALVTQVRLLGVPARYPEYLPANDFAPLAERLARLRSQGRPAYVRTIGSIATRVAAAACERGLDLSGSVFSVTGEPLTQSKRELIERCGAKIYTWYACNEFGHLGHPCAGMHGHDRVHLLEDSVMLIPHRPPGAEHEGLLVTSFLPCGPRIAINVGVDDTAVIEEGRCDCEYQRLGLTMQAHSIFSYGKVTTQGMTIAGADVADLIESQLPAHFGGGPGDYQLAEVDGSAQSELVLRLSPRIGHLDPARVRDFTLERLGAIFGGSLSQRLWRFTGGFRVVIEEPEATATGKVHPLRLRAAGSARSYLTQA